MEPTAFNKAQAAAAAIKAYYFNRAGIELQAEYAGRYARAAGHPDDHVLVHASAAGPGRPEGSVIASPKGWYDAGDYNKYVVNSAISVYTLLAAYEQFPEFFARQDLHIPESGNGLPDLLNEALWNLDWMLAMQDPADGGVYHKLTNKGFDGVVMPHQANGERYVVQKTTAAALDFAAVMAQASRVFAAFDAQRPGLSARMLAASNTGAHLWSERVEPMRCPAGGHGGAQATERDLGCPNPLRIAVQDCLRHHPDHSLPPRSFPFGEGRKPQRSGLAALISASADPAPAWFERSPSETTPVARSSSTTGSRRTFRSFIRLSAPRTVAVGGTATTSPLQISPTSVDGPMPFASARMAMSRSVTIPTTRSVPGSTTITSPIPWSAMMRAASLIEVFGVTVSGNAVMTSRTSRVSSMSTVRIAIGKRCTTASRTFPSTRWIGSARRLAPSAYPAPNPRMVPMTPIAASFR